MDIKTIDKDLLNELLQKALKSERHRYAYDLRNSPEDTSQIYAFVAICMSCSSKKGKGRLRKSRASGFVLRKVPMGFRFPLGRGIPFRCMR